MARVGGSDWLQKLNTELDDQDARSLSARGTYTAVAGDATANAAEIDTGATGATGFLVQIYRADVLANGDAEITLVDGVLTIADGASTYAVTAGDVINWLVF